MIGSCPYCGEQTIGGFHVSSLLIGLIGGLVSAVLTWLVWS